MSNPVLKWAGGKRQLLPEILSKFPKDYRLRSYHEPFIGGGAVFFNIKPTNGTINDVNPRLMNFYKIVRDHPEKLIELAKSYIHDKEEYYKIRDRYNQPELNDVEDAALLLYLNKTAFNGLYRVNSKGKFNVPFGSYKNPTIVDEDRLYKASDILKSVDIFCTDFSYILEIVKQGDLCYFDPPYLPVSETARFTSYSKGGFSYEDQIRLRDTCVQLNAKGVLFVLSNSYVPPLVKKYQEIENFEVNIVNANRAINSVGSKRGPVKEILVTNVPNHLSSTLNSFVEN